MSGFALEAIEFCRLSPTLGACGKLGSEPLVFLCLLHGHFCSFNFVPFHVSFPEVRHLHGWVTVAMDYPTVAMGLLQTDTATLLLSAAVKGCAVRKSEGTTGIHGNPRWAERYPG